MFSDIVTLICILFFYLNTCTLRLFSSRFTCKNNLLIKALKMLTANVFRFFKGVITVFIIIIHHVDNSSIDFSNWLTGCIYFFQITITVFSSSIIYTKYCNHTCFNPPQPTTHYKSKYPDCDVASLLVKFPIFSQMRTINLPPLKHEKGKHQISGRSKHLLFG